MMEDELRSLDELIDEIIVDACNEYEQICAFVVILEEEIAAPMPAEVVREPVEVLSVDYEGDERQGPGVRRPDAAPAATGDGGLSRRWCRAAGPALPEGSSFRGASVCRRLGNKALGRLRDVAPIVVLANVITRRWPAGRPLEYVHAPFAAGDEPAPLDEAFYRPLSGLRLPTDVRFVAGSTTTPDRACIAPPVSSPLQGRVRFIGIDEAGESHFSRPEPPVHGTAPTLLSHNGSWARMPNHPRRGHAL